MASGFQNGDLESSENLQMNGLIWLKDEKSNLKPLRLDNFGACHRNPDLTTKASIPSKGGSA